MKNKRIIIIALLCVIIFSLIISPVGKTIQKAINPNAKKLDKSEMVSYNINNLTLQENNDPEKGFYGKIINVPLDYKPNTRSDFETLVNAAGYTYYEVSEGLDKYENGTYTKGNSKTARTKTHELVAANNASNTTVIINASSYFWGGWTAQQKADNYELANSENFNSQWEDLENLISSNKESNYYINLSVPRDAPLQELWGIDFMNEKMTGIDGSEVTVQEGILQYIWIEYYIKANGNDALPDNMKNYYNNFFINNLKYADIVKSEINKYDRFMSYAVKAVAIKNKYPDVGIDLVISAESAEISSYIKIAACNVENGYNLYKGYKIPNPYGGVKKVLTLFDINNSYAWKDEYTGELYGNIFNVIHTIHDANQLILSRELAKDTGIGAYYQVLDLKTGNELDGSSGLWEKLYNHNQGWGTTSQTIGFLTTGEQIVEKNNFINHSTQSDINLGKTISLIKRQNICLYLNDTVFDETNNTYVDYLISDSDVQEASKNIKTTINSGANVELIDLSKAINDKSRSLYQAIIESGNLFKLAGLNNSFFYSGNNTIGIGLAQAHVQSVLEYAFENKITGKDTFDLNPNLQNYKVRLVKINEQKLKTIMKDWAYCKYIALTDEYTTDINKKILYTNGKHTGIEQGSSIKELFNNTQVEFGKITYQFDVEPNVNVTFPWNNSKHAIGINLTTTGNLWIGGRSDLGDDILNVSSSKITTKEGDITEFTAKSNVANAKIKFQIQDDANILISKDKKNWYSSSNISDFEDVSSGESIYIKGIRATGDSPAQIVTYLDYQSSDGISNHKEVSTTVTVIQNGTEELRLSKYSFNINTDETIEITAYSNSPDATITWYCLDADTNDMVFLTRSSKSGETQSYTFKKKRNVLIQVSTNINGKVYTANVYITVNETTTTPDPEDSLEGIYINTTPYLKAFGAYLNETRDFSAELKKGINATYTGNLDDLEIVWKSDNSNIASVASANKGKGFSITGKSEGSTNIIGYLKDDPTIKREIKVTVYNEEKPVKEKLKIEVSGKMRAVYWEGEKLDLSYLTFKVITGEGSSQQEKILTKSEVANKITWKANTDDYINDQFILDKNMKRIEFWYNAQQAVDNGGRSVTVMSIPPVSTKMNLKTVYGSLNKSLLQERGIKYNEIGDRINLFVDNDGDQVKIDFVPMLLMNNNFNEAINTDLIEISVNGNKLEPKSFYDIEDEFSVSWNSDSYDIYAFSNAIGKSYKINVKVVAYESILNKEFTVNVFEKGSSIASIKEIGVSGYKIFETNDTIKKSQYKVLGICEDGSESVLDGSEYKIDFLQGNTVIKTINKDENTSLTGEDVKLCDSVAVTAYSMTETFPLKVVDTTTPDEEKDIVMIESIANQASYDANHTFSANDFLTTAIYVDGTKADVTSDSVTIIGKTTTTPMAIVKYSGLVTRVPVTLTTGGSGTTTEVSSIEIATAPTKTSYKEGEVFDKTGIKINAVYTDGTKTDITSSCTYSPSGALAITDNKITITYTDLSGTTFTTYQTITVTSSSEGEGTTPNPSEEFERVYIEQSPIKVVYIEGERFLPSGMVIKGEKSDGTKEIISSYTYSPAGPLTRGDTVINIVCTDSKGNTYTLQQAILVTADANPNVNFLTGIEITNPPTKIEYIAGEELNLNGMVVTAKYFNGESKQCYTYTTSPKPGVKLTTKDNLITVTYTEDGVTKSATQEIKVKSGGTDTPTDPDVPVTKKLSGIRITVPPTQTNYNVGDKLDLSGMVVEAEYSDGTKANVTNYTVSPSGTLTINDKTMVVTYTEGGITQSATLNITVTNNQEPEKTLTGLVIKNQPNKLEYIEGQYFNSDGMTVYAQYSDGTETLVTNYTISPNTALTISNNKVVITYTEGDTTKTAELTIKVNKKQLVGIRIKNQPSKTQYIEGQTFSTEGMVVVAEYNDGTEKNVTSYKVTPAANLELGTNKVTITYEEDGVTYTVEQAIIVVAKSSATINYSTKELTKDNVIVKIEANQVITNAQVVNAEEWKSSSDNKSIYKVFEQNGEEKVIITTEDGEMHEFNVVVNNIDKTPLEIKVDYQYNETDNTVTVTITSNREINEYSINDRESWTLSTDKKTLTKTYKVNTEENIVIEDILGNKAEKTIKVTTVKTPMDDPNGNNNNGNNNNGNNNNGNQNNGNGGTSGNNSNSTQNAGQGKDNTMSNSILPYTGFKTIMISLIIISSLVGAINFYRYKKNN